MLFRSEWNNEEIQQAFLRLTKAAAQQQQVRKTSETPHLRGLWSASPWSEIDEYHLPAANVNKTTLLEFVETLKYQLNDEAKMLVFGLSEESISLYQQSIQQEHVHAKHICFVNLDDPNVCARIHTELPDWLANISYVTVWFPQVDSSEEGRQMMNLDMQTRLFFFLSCIQSKELSGFMLHCNNPVFTEMFLAEKKAREDYLQQFLYAQRRTRPFSSICLSADTPTNQGELASYVANKPVR